MLGLSKHQILAVVIIVVLVKIIGPKLPVIGTYLS